MSDTSSSAAAAERILAQWPQGITPQLFQQLLQDAKSACAKSYSPYSHFPVGAAILTASGHIYKGCNVENASFGLTNCAERTAIFSAVAAGAREIKAVVIYTPTEHPASPCGACRQVIHEFGRDCVIASACDGTDTLVMSSQEMIPHAFGPRDLGAAEP